MPDSTLLNELAHASRAEGAYIVASQFCAAIVFLSLALSRVLRAAKPTARKSRLFAVSLAAVIMPVTLGAVLCAQWDPIGVPYEKDWRVAVPAVPAERDVQIRALLTMWKTVNRERADSNATRDEITTIPPREWAIPGEAGVNWLYVRGDDDSFFIAEPFPIDGERLVTDDGLVARPIEDSDVEKIRRSPGGGL